MNNKTSWSRNQILMLVVVILSAMALIVSILSLIFSHSAKQSQVIIKQEIDEIKSKIGDFETISADNANFGSLNASCPPGTSGGAIISDRGIQLNCLPVDK